MKICLNVGSGPWAHIAGPEWLNVDRNDLPHWPQPPDVVLDVLGCPFEELAALAPPDGFAKVYCGHILEHVAEDRVPVLLRRLVDVMAPDGEIVVVGPDMDAALAQGEPTSILDGIRAADDPDASPDGIEHRWTPTATGTLDLVRQVFPDAVLVDIDSISSPDWPNVSHARWQCAIRARKG